MQRNGLEILLAPYEFEVRVGVHITLLMQCAAEALRSAEEDARFRGLVNLADAPEYGIPVGSTEGGWSS